MLNLSATLKLNQFLNMKNTLNVAKIVIAGIPLSVVFVWFVYLQIDGYRNSKRFFKKQFSSKVVKSKSYYGRSTEFHLENGLKLYFRPPAMDKIGIGDSIQKDSNTNLYTVYRKNMEGHYIFDATYDYERIY